ncbi:LacI family DNA-binding transcriptional regulator [Mucilaginibacter arboris]|uniref:Substrate-binding domain-containing protein n=1 Tax=Mucilaginibacter arboris TaxID=2682090 RepID=A0A7K1SXJ7_9SPHI|nr:LacI family DNA-binding transcriptional regulator [Mucilaginibacter arboris]MVN22033.1 substrate-binding domain-containing protein [Mucilaginibacter arboris]
MSEPEKEITIYDIAKKLNISAATVSRGLKDHPGVNKNTKKKITDAAHEMGYRSNAFASNLRKKSSNIIGVIVPRLNSSFMSDVIAGMEQVVNEANYNLIISQSLETVKKEVSNARAMFNNRVDGLLVSLAYDTKDIEHFKPFINRGIPVIFFDRIFEHAEYPTIFIDNYKAAYEVTTHLIEQGCKKIVHLTGNQLRNVYAERFKGYKQALADHQLAFDEDLVLINSLSSADGADAAKQILNMHVRPDAVFAANDSCAIGCMLEMKKQGIKIPADIAFAGFNNDPMCCVIEPNLTTVNYKGYEMGGVAARVLIGNLTNQLNTKTTHSIILRSELIIRESSVRNKR